MVIVRARPMTMLLPSYFFRWGGHVRYTMPSSRVEREEYALALNHSLNVQSIGVYSLGLSGLRARIRKLFANLNG